MRRSADPRYTSCLPLKSMTSQLSLEPRINVSKQKLIENERNEILKFFHFFQKKKYIFSNFENPLKKTAPGAVFFEKLIQLQNCLESLQIIFRTFGRYLWKGLTSHLTILRL